MIDGVPGEERAWADTKRHLAKYLADISDNTNENANASYQEIYNEIVRAHRGTKGKKDEHRIYVRLVSSEMVDYVKKLAFKKKDLFVNQMHSPKINERLCKGRNLIRTLRSQEESKNWKMFLNDKCQLMVKRHGTRVYSVYKQF